MLLRRAKKNVVNASGHILVHLTPSCVNVFRRNHNNPGEVYAEPTADDEDCVITPCVANPDMVGVRPPAIPPPAPAQFPAPIEEEELFEADMA